MADLTKIARTALGSAALAVIPASVGAVTLDTEPNNPFASAQPATAGDLISGHLCLDVGPCTPLDTADFFHYTGLPPGGTFDFSFTPTDTDFGDTLTAGRYSSTGVLLDSVSSTGALVHLPIGTIPGSGELFFGITGPGACCAEGYTARLSVTGARVPAPAAIVLLAAGLAALGLDTARRRKRS
jgi:hypothetical protein